MQTLFHAVQCSECGHEMAVSLLLDRCKACGSPWIEARYDLTTLPADWAEHLLRRPMTLWRYCELLPFPDEFPVLSMGEGGTPLTRAWKLERASGHEEIWIKDERQQPTGSFKDRQAALAVSALVAQGIEEMVLASTGNAAAAYAAFCARAGIKLWVFLTSSVPAEKMRELALYGAEVVKITGTYDQAKEVAADFAERRGIYKDLGAKGIMGKESMKTIAFEIAEQLGRETVEDDETRRWQAPDWYIQAVSGGIGPLGVLKGFEELHAAGLTDRVPKLGIVQAEGCSPMVQAWEKGLDKVEPVYPDTLVTVLSTGKPGLTYEILKAACDRDGGAMVSVSDGDTFRAMRRVARVEGFSMEPAASVAFAGLEKLLKTDIAPGERVVVNCSGHTFSAEKHALEDRYAFHLGTTTAHASEGLSAALEQLDEQITTIVVIDDNPHDSRLLRRLLQSYKQYRVFEAHSGPDGLDLVHQRQPDLVVMDLKMPKMDGFAILEALKRDVQTREIPVIVVSAKSLTAEEWERLYRHTESVWQKGNFSARELVGHVVGVLGDEVAASPSGRTSFTMQSHADHGLDTFGQNGKPLILVVDAVASDARLLHRIFEARQRYHVIEAHSGGKALTLAEQHRPDLIVLNLTLPDIEGTKVLQALREQRSTCNAPAIILSEEKIDAALRTRLASQVDSIWSKNTLDRNHLLAHVEAILSE